MAHPQRSQLFSFSLLSVQHVLLLAILSAAGYLISHARDILEFFARLDFDLCHTATQAVQQFYHF